MNFRQFIQLFAGEIVTESKLDKNKKLDLLEFIKNANEYEIMTLLMDGEEQEIKTEQSKRIVLERFKRTQIPNKFKYFLENSNVIQERGLGTVTLQGLGILSYFLGRGVVRQIKGLLDKCYRKCKPIIKDQYKFQICRLTCQLKAMEKELDEMKKINCNKRDKPRECKEKVTKTIKKIQKKMSDKKERIKTLKAEMD